MQIIRSKNLIWIDIKNPSEEDILWLRRHYNLHPLVLKEILPPIDYPKIENFDDYLFIVLFYPFFDKETYQIIPFELDIIVAKNYIITSHYKDIVPLKAIFDRCNLYDDIREEYTDEGSGELLYRLIRQIFLACLPKLSHLKAEIDTIEMAIYKGNYEKTVKRSVRKLRHQVTCPWTQVNGNEAISVCYFDAYYVDNSTGVLGLAAGRYEHKLVEVPQIGLQIWSQ